MARIKDQAIVVRLQPLREADLIVGLFSLAGGRLDVRAICGRKSIKRFGGILQPFTRFEAELQTRRRDRMATLVSAHLIDPFMELREDLAKIALASWYCELVGELSPHDQGEPLLFELLAYFLDRLKTVPATLKHRVFFELRLLDILGLRPDLDHCAQSGIPLKTTAFVDPSIPGLVATSDKPLSDICRESTRKALTEALDRPLKELSSVCLTRSQALEAKALLTPLLLDQLPHRPRSLKMLEEELTA